MSGRRCGSWWVTGLVLVIAGGISAGLVWADGGTGAPATAPPAAEEIPGAPADVPLPYPPKFFAPRSRGDESGKPPEPSPGDSPSKRLIEKVPAQEVKLNTGFPEEGNPDYSPRAFGLPDGRLCVLEVENFRLRALYSADGGASFAPEIDIAGREGEAEVHSFNAALAPDGWIYAALVTAGPEEGMSLSMVRSPDMGLSWSDPLLLARSDEIAHSAIPYTIAVAAAEGGSATIVWSGYNTGEAVSYHAVSTTDHGKSWTAPVRLDDGSGSWSAPDVAIDGSSKTIYTVFTQSVFLPAQENYRSIPVLRRSLDGGASFLEAVPLTVLATHSHTDRIEAPTVAIASDKSVLVAANSRGQEAWWAGWDHFVVAARSTDGGVSFDRVFRGNGYPSPEYSPWLLPSPDSGTVLLAQANTSYALNLWRSTDNGATFGDSQTLTGESAVPYSLVDPSRLIRTSAGTWAIAWTDFRNGDAQRVYDVYARVSRDDGVSWGEEQRLSSPSSGPVSSFYPFLAPAGADDLIAVFTDTRNEDGTGRDIRASRTGEGGPGIFGPDRRIDQDFGSSAPGTSILLSSASDGASHVYAAFLAASEGVRQDLYFVASSDGGRHFGAPVRVSTWPPGSRYVANSAIATCSDGEVYVLSASRAGGDWRWQLRLNRSADFGASWLEEDILIGSTSTYPHDGLRLACAEGGKVYVAWGSSAGYILSRSLDGGLHFEDRVFESLPWQERLLPALCAQGDRVYLGWRANHRGNRVYLATSFDSGASFSDSFPPTEGTSWGSLITIDCHPGTGRAVAVWEDFSASPFVLRSSVFDGEGWNPASSAAFPPGLDFGFEVIGPGVRYASEDGSMVVASSWLWNGAEQRYKVAVMTSDNGGRTFSFNQLLGEETFYPKLTSDREGKAWIFWLEDFDYSVGSTVTVSRSTDGGASFGPPRKLNSKLPQGGFYNWYEYSSLNACALPGAGLLAYAGQQDTPAYSALINRDDLNDADGDGFDGSADCDDSRWDVYPEAPQLCDGINNDCSDPSWPSLPVAERDDDTDGFIACADNCPDTFNPDQLDADGDGLGDACDLHVSVVVPGDNSMGVPLETDVTVTFSEPVDPATVGFIDADGDGTLDTHTFQLLEQGHLLGAVSGVSEDGLRASLDPDLSLTPGAVHQVRVTRDVKTPLGESLTPFDSFFETEEEASPPGEELGSIPDSDVTEGEQKDEAHGASLAYTGDVNHDGLTDRLVGAPGYDVKQKAGEALADAGRVSLYLGSRDSGDDVPDIIFEGAGAGDLLGISVGGGEDVNGDGTPDLILGASQFGGAANGEGRAYLIYFDPADYPHLGDPSVTDTVGVEEVADVTFTGGTKGDRAGHAVDLSPDADADGLGEVLVGAPGAGRDGLTDRGESYLVFGAKDLPPVVDLSQVGLPGGIGGVAYLGVEAGDGLGWSVSMGADFNGDGTPDLMLGAPFYDTIHPAPKAEEGEEFEDAGMAIIDVGPLFRGVLEVDSVGDDSVDHDGILMVGDQPDQHVGQSVAMVPDHNGDGYDEALAGAPGSDVERGATDAILEDAGEAFLQPGDDISRLGRGVLEVDGYRDQVDPAGTAFQGGAAGDELGTAVGTAGDTNGDGADEIIIGAPGVDAPDPDEGLDASRKDAGATYLEMGAFTPLFRGVLEVDSLGRELPGEIYYGENAGDRSGSALAGGGDVDGDGKDDFSVGAPGADPEGTDNAGASYTVTEEPAPLPDGPEPCGPRGCSISDLDTGAQIDVPEGSLGRQTPVRAEGILDSADLPGGLPRGRRLLGAATFSPEETTFHEPYPTVYIPLAGEKGEGSKGDESERIYDLYYWDGTFWLDSGVDGVEGPNPRYPERRSVIAEVSILHSYALFENTAVENQPPVADAGEDQTLECENGQATVLLDGSGSTDPDGAGDITRYEWLESGVSLGSGVTVSVNLALGEHRITLRVTDREGASSTDEVLVTVEDTRPPEGTITAPAWGSCFGAPELPVVIEDDFTDTCESDLERSYEPPGDPWYSGHGDWPVTLTVSDSSGNAAAAEAFFTIDLLPPAVEILAGPGQYVLPMTVPFSEVMATSDDDGATGEVVHETIAIDGCVVYDGATYGDGDGLLLDEEVTLDEAALARYSELCHRNEWIDPVVTLGATDCGGNLAEASIVIPGSMRLVEE